MVAPKRAMSPANITTHAATCRVFMGVLAIIGGESSEDELLKFFAER
jgi:hypothetical protein